MTRRVAGRSRRWLAFTVMVGCTTAPHLAAAQPVEPQRQPGGFSSESAEFGVRPRDYFTRSHDPEVLYTVQITERYHLSEDNFWLKRREGHVSAARQDLHFILRYIPNHPRVLQLLAYDPVVKQDPSDMIWHFERAIRTFPNSAYTYAQYGHYLVTIGRPEAGIRILDDALRLDPGLLVARAWYAEAMSADSSRAAP